MAFESMLSPSSCGVRIDSGWNWTADRQFDVLDGHHTAVGRAAVMRSSDGWCERLRRRVAMAHLEALGGVQQLSPWPARTRWPEPR